MWENTCLFFCDEEFLLLCDPLMVFKWHAYDDGKRLCRTVFTLRKFNSGEPQNFKLEPVSQKLAGDGQYGTILES